MDIAPLMPLADAPPAPLSYAGTDTRPALAQPWRTVALRLVLACWALPLVAGLAIFMVALALGKHCPEGVAEAGWWNILAGTGLAGTGGIAALAFVAGRWQASAGDRWRMALRPALLGCLLLASNFVVAAALVWVVVQSDAF